MIYKWNKELKRQGSASRTRSRRSIMKQIDEVADKEARVITSDCKELSKQEMQRVAKQVDDLYQTFPRQMADSFHQIYEKEVAKKIRGYLR